MVDFIRQVMLCINDVPLDGGFGVRLAHLAPDLVPLFFVERLEVGVKGRWQLNNRADFFQTLMALEMVLRGERGKGRARR
jgi:hypothetical protein